ncbi:hypothetical protein [Spiroplasma diminutum]|uniref:Uncharacterized protein n=1 Tax=Spiroplasma diminutum CUAS-1 TaxID=1276221 RepID=S5LZ69_9MOLU|nr:hypothetical protein [Spiroplasma diminutum]AGR41866.1 hypothetical protein SDIMI_v3c01620 [Spiroplasma diminutum CUAS-1]
MKSNQIIGLSLLIIGVLILISFLLLAYYVKNKSKASFKLNNKESQTIWEFTKKNFPIFFALFGFVMAFSGLMMMF